MIWPLGNLFLVSHLQLGKHRFFTVDTGRLAYQEPLGKILLVKRLEYVFAVDKPDKIGS